MQQEAATEAAGLHDSLAAKLPSCTQSDDRIGDIDMGPEIFHRGIPPKYASETKIETGGEH